jgi:hypothetical protein
LAGLHWASDESWGGSDLNAYFSKIVPVKTFEFMISQYFKSQARRVKRKIPFTVLKRGCASGCEDGVKIIETITTWEPKKKEIP